MVFELDSSLRFPDPALAEEDGWLAIGGDLSVDRLKLAYENGIFPWYSEGEPICWYSPHKRCVIFPEDIIVSKSMKGILSKKTFEIRVDSAFEKVIYSCSNSTRRGQDGTWISPEMQKAYVNMYERGFAHSVEAWQNGQLVGGLYGIAVNNVFCGESMFSHVSNASKAALIWLCREGNYLMIDCQMPTDHLFTLGAKIIDRDAYLQIIQEPPLLQNNSNVPG